VEERGGHPACVRGVGKRGDVGLLRIDYPGFSGAGKLQPIDWNEFFDQFEKQKLAFLHQDTKGGKTSRFSKLVDRSEMRRRDHGRSARGEGSKSARGGGGSRAGSRSASSRSSKSTAGRARSASGSTRGRHGR
jgi:hypothetical protein